MGSDGSFGSVLVLLCFRRTSVFNTLSHHYYEDYREMRLFWTREEHEKGWKGKGPAGPVLFNVHEGFSACMFLPQARHVKALEVGRKNAPTSRPRASAPRILGAWALQGAARGAARAEDRNARSLQLKSTPISLSKHAGQPTLKGPEMHSGPTPP